MLTVALESVGRSLRWHDARDATFQMLNLSNNGGLIVNLVSPGILSTLFGGRHWFALRKFDGKWYNLDSRLREPEVLLKRNSEMDDGDEDAGLRFFLSQLQQESDAIVFVIS